MTDTVAVANYRSRLEAELAARLLEGAAIPYVINSPEGMLHGPLPGGATILVRAADADLARELLREWDDRREPPEARRVALLPAVSESDRLVDGLRAAGVPALVRTVDGMLEVWVRREHADRAARLLDGRRREGA